METAVGFSLSGIRVHPDSNHAGRIGAMAYAQGNRIYVAPGHFNPETPSGRRLLGHEVAHVVQQAQGRVAPDGHVNGLAINSDPKLELEADRLGDQVAWAQPHRSADILAGQHPLRESTAVASGGSTVVPTAGICQMEWERSSTHWRWTGPGQPTAADIDEANQAGVTIENDNMGRRTGGGGGGFYQRGGSSRMVTIDGVTKQQRRGVKRGRSTGETHVGDAFTTDEADDTTSYFDDRLQVHHRGEGIERQAVGAPLPAGPVSAPLRSNPHESMAWLQESQLPQTKRRRPEKQIMGSSARDAKDGCGVTSRPYDAWAHTRPDHTHPPGREDPRMRHPSTVQANQVHSAFESATAGMVEDFGALPVSRDLGPEVPRGGGLHADMGMTVGLPVGDDFNFLTHRQPYLSQQGARGGDAEAIRQFMELEYFRGISQSCGAMESDDGSSYMDDEGMTEVDDDTSYGSPS